jgi:hypothetical protein
MAIRTLSLKAIEKFTPSSDPDKGKPGATVFHLRTLPSRVFGAIVDGSMTFTVDTSGQADENAEASSQMNMKQANYELAAFAMVGFDNLPDPEADEGSLTFKDIGSNVGGKSYRRCRSEIMDVIPADVIDEIAAKVREMNGVSEEEEKN